MACCGAPGACQDQPQRQPLLRPPPGRSRSNRRGSALPVGGRVRGSRGVQASRRGRGAGRRLGGADGGGGAERDAGAPMCCAPVAPQGWRSRSSWPGRYRARSWPAKTGTAKPASAARGSSRPHSAPHPPASCRPSRSRWWTAWPGAPPASAQPAHWRSRCGWTRSSPACCAAASTSRRRYVVRPLSCPVLVTAPDRCRRCGGPFAHVVGVTNHHPTAAKPRYRIGGTPDLPAPRPLGG